MHILRTHSWDGHLCSLKSSPLGFMGVGCPGGSCGAGAGHRDWARRAQRQGHLPLGWPQGSSVLPHPDVSGPRGEGSRCWHCDVLVMSNICYGKSTDKGRRESWIWETLLLFRSEFVVLSNSKKALLWQWIQRYLGIHQPVVNIQWAEWKMHCVLPWRHHPQNCLVTGHHFFLTQWAQKSF